MGPLKLAVKLEEWPFKVPFQITGHVFRAVEVVLVTLTSGQHRGRGEAAGVYYKQDRPPAICEQIEALRPRLEAGITRNDLRKILPPGGARNAVDCALWDLEAKVSGRPAWQIAGLTEPRPLLTTFTCGAELPEKMAAAAKSYTQARAIKVKLTGEPIDADRIRAVREARTDVWLAVDANQGFTRATLEQLMPVLLKAQIQLIEQPFPVGQDALLDGFYSPIPVAADESVQCLRDLSGLVGRFDMINIKLDKCGGLTEALEMHRSARRMGLKVLVGNMLGTSLAMAPAFLLGQLCDLVDLDGPMFQSVDREVTVDYCGGEINCPQALWGYE